MTSSLPRVNGSAIKRAGAMIGMWRGLFHTQEENEETAATEEAEGAEEAAERRKEKKEKKQERVQPK